MSSRPPETAAGSLRAVHASLLVAQLLFAGLHVVGRSLLATVDPLALAGWRVALATPLLLAYAWWHDRVLPRRADVPGLAILGLLGVSANQILFLYGLRWTTATNAAILMPSIPVFAVAVAALSGIERIGRRRLLGIACSVAGALALLDPRRFSLGDETTLGNLLVLANCLCYSIFLVAQRPLLERLPWRSFIAWAFLFGSLAVIGLSLGPMAALDPAPATLAGLAYIVLFPTVIAYSLATWAVKRSSPSMVAAYITAQPPMAALLAALFLGERLHPSQGLGFALIAGGLIIVSTGRAKVPPALAPEP